MCVKTMPRRKYVGNYFRGAIVAAHQSRKGYKAIFKQLGVRYAVVRKFQVWMFL